MVVEIYSKPECPLCEEAKELLQQLRSRLCFELREIDISKAPELFGRFKYDIPVVFVNGRRLFTHRIDAAHLEELLSG